MQLSDSALPTGRFAHSYGLEAWLADRGRPEPAELEEFSASTVSEVVAPLDGVIVAHAHRADSIATLVALDDAVSIRRLTRSASDASRLPGRALATLAVHLTEDDLVHSLAELVEAGEIDGHLPVVHGILTRALGIGTRKSVAIDLHAIAAGMMSAAVRLGALSPRASQIMIRALASTIAAAADTATAATLDEIHSNGAELDILHMCHRYSHGRHFMT